MRAKTLQIMWHETQPVFSVDFHPDGYLATGGGDREIKVRPPGGAGGRPGRVGLDLSAATSNAVAQWPQPLFRPPQRHTTSISLCP